jgi:glycosyltransferase involved in cell wall biosynthesis
MMHLFINALAASAGGGLTYVRNVIPQLMSQPGVKVSLAVGGNFREEFRHFGDIEFLEFDVPPIRRFWFEQSRLPELIERSGAGVLLSTGNFALRKSPVPQILLSRNSIYTSADFYRDLRRRYDFGAWTDTHVRSILAKRSIHWADVTVAPSEAFAAELRKWTGVNVRAIHHGFDRAAFVRDERPLAEEVETKLHAAEGSLKLLFVSHYNYYRNFETLIRALPGLRDRITDRRVRLLLTCELSAGKNPGAYQPDSAAGLIKDLGVAEMVVELGTLPYEQLHQLYSRADLYVTPAYTETFAHPLVEAMSSGLPVVASDIPVHREICQEAAVYFEKFSPTDLAEKVAGLAKSGEARKRMATAGNDRAKQFSWKSHVEKILAVAEDLVNSVRSPVRALAHT